MGLELNILLLPLRQTAFTRPQRWGEWRTPGGSVQRRKLKREQSCSSGGSPALMVPVCLPSTVKPLAALLRSHFEVNANVHKATVIVLVEAVSPGLHLWKHLGTHWKAVEAFSSHCSFPQRACCSYALRGGGIPGLITVSLGNTVREQSEILHSSRI
jgi:hypothetical protein